VGERSALPTAPSVPRRSLGITKAALIPLEQAAVAHDRGDCEEYLTGITKQAQTRPDEWITLKLDIEHT
jgi:hypothetical protein